jgi:CheY-like chemotaxis protein
MPFRVREALLVSSSYDAFVLEEDGSLADRLFHGFAELNLSAAPRLMHAARGADALALLEERAFDLVITVVRVADTDAAELSSAIKERHPSMPVVLLVFDEADLALFPDHRPPPTVDHVFQWAGQPGVLLAAIKLVEDGRNLVHDTRAAGVQVILVVEDRVRAYSAFLSLLYPELLTQAGSLVAEGVNAHHRLLRMRGRPKVALAATFEHGLAVYDEHRAFIGALVSDVDVPVGGALEREGGIALARYIRAADPDLPILLHSTDADAAAAAEALSAAFVSKHDPSYRVRVRGFLREALGFGDFVFRLPDRTEVARARDVFDMERLLAHVPVESIAFHAARNHFSMWLMARGMFQLARELRPRRLDEFASVEALRAHLSEVLRRAHQDLEEGAITDFSPRHTGPRNRFVRVGQGSLGGKGRGVAFLSGEIVRHRLLERFPGLEVRIPKTVVVGTGVFERFMEQVDLAALLALEDDRAVTERLLGIPFPHEAVGDLRAAFDALKGPLAVRSSSLLEDSRFRPFAGVYATYMLPNNHPDTDARFTDMLQAIRCVYASTHWAAARRYLAGTPHALDDQRMAVVIQQVVGRAWGPRFYPHVSGVAQSHNHYPVCGQRAEDGVAHVALGLGHTVVSGGAALRFSPGAPSVLPQFPTARAFAAGSQTELYALDLGRARLAPLEGPEASLVVANLETAERDGSLAHVGSVYVAGDDVIRDDLSLAGARIVTFNHLLKWNVVPFAEALRVLLALLRDAMGEQVEIELALDLAPPGQGRAARLYLLQLRPMSAPGLGRRQREVADLPLEALLCRTETALGDGAVEGVRDVVWVEARALDLARGRALARALRELNARLKSEGRPYLLVGPGRWGSADPTLGIPVGWSDIAGAAVIVETAIGERFVEPSQGTHFFRNITAARVGYLTLGADRRWHFDARWLEAQPTRVHGGVRHARLAEPLGIYIDGRTGRAAVAKTVPTLDTLRAP